MSLSRTFLTTVMLLGCALTGGTSLAQAPAGSITNQVVGRTNALWDVSLFEGLQTPQVILTMSGKNATNYWKCLQGEANPIPLVPGSDNTNLNYNMLGVSLTVPFVQDGRGRLSGKGTNALGVSYINRFWTGNIFEGLYGSTNMLDLTNIVDNYVVSGSVQGVVGGGAILRYTGRASCLLPLSGKSRRLSVTDAVYVLVDATKTNLMESFANIISVASQRTLSAGGKGNDPIPDYLGDGTWTLVLNFDPVSATAPTRLSGTASVTLNSGAVYPFSFTGRYSPKTGQSALLLKGVKNDSSPVDGRGASLAVTVANGQVGALQGRVAGQVIKRK